MSFFTSSQISELFGGREGIQLVDKLVKRGICSKEYKVNNEGRITSVRYNIAPIKPLLENVANLLKYLKKRSIESPRNADKVRERLAFARLNECELILFSPWGCRYARNLNLENETKTLQEIEEILGKFRENNYRTKFLLMLADLYGTEINQLPESLVKEYFEKLMNLASKTLGDVTNLVVKPWSKIREENKVRYQELRRVFESEFDQKVKKGMYERTIATAKYFGSKNPEESARRYCIERLIEGYLIEELYAPLKLSLVRKEKDMLDGPLPGIYVIKNTAPWLERW